MIFSPILETLRIFRSNENLEGATLYFNKMLADLISPFSTKTLEAETSPEVVRIIMPSTLLSYQIQCVMMDVQYNPTVGINIISNSLAQQLYLNKILYSYRKIFQDPMGPCWNVAVLS
jgi:hypothetical protein